MDISPNLELKIRVALGKALDCYVRNITCFRTRDDGLVIENHVFIDPYFLLAEIECQQEPQKSQIADIGKYFFKYKFWQLMKLSTPNRYLIILRTNE